MVLTLASWRTQALCVGKPSEIFFSEEEDHSINHEAKNICKSCPSALDCLMYAIQGTEKLGVWGGTSPAQRTKIFRLRRCTGIKDPYTLIYIWLKDIRHAKKVLLADSLISLKESLVES